jgi:hypothetical protein
LPWSSTFPPKLSSASDRACTCSGQCQRGSIQGTMDLAQMQKHQPSPLPKMLTHLSFSVPALCLAIRAMDRGTDKVSSQRFSYFGSLAMGEEGDGGACTKQRRVSGHRPARHGHCAQEGSSALNQPVPKIQIRPSSMDKSECEHSLLGSTKRNQVLSYLNLKDFLLF